MNLSSYRFTIFTPCFNSENFIHRVIESIELQTYKNFEWLVINDASTDGTGKILDDYSVTAPFAMRIIHNPQNYMLYYNFNLAFNEAKGEFIIFAGHDDKFHPETLEVLNDVWQKYGNENISGIWSLCKDQFGKLIGNKFSEDLQINNYFRIFEKYIYRQERFVCMRTEVLKKYPFDIVNNRIGETFLWESISQNFNIIFINKVLRTYYIEQENMNSLTKAPRIKNALPIYISYSDWINKYLTEHSFSIKFDIRFHFAFTFYGLLLKKGLKNILKDVCNHSSKIKIILLFPLAIIINLALSNDHRR
jgi:glycosyltransferase involved in cell wall biosynthesis